MASQITRNNHYVPQWYQRGFLPKGQHKLHVLNMSPIIEVHGKPAIPSKELEFKGPKQSFQAFDLYTTSFGEKLNDEVERFLFGAIDTNGALAVRAWIAGDGVQMHTRFQDFFSYLDAQKLRTPKGLDWILSQYRGLSQLDLMLEMQQLRTMHATMWTECVREIVSARKSAVKFLVSDHPVTVYHGDLSPDSPECQYPADPGIELVGSQTLFPLDSNHCLILTNLEHAENPHSGASLARRANARFRGPSLARTDALIRKRDLSEDDVNAINRILKSRARQYVAASNPDWLYPERLSTAPWKELGKVLHPGRDLWKFGGEIFIGYEDGTTEYRDKFGRTTSHAHLAKKKPEGKLEATSECGCGSGLSYSQCCELLPPQNRPRWDVYSIRERNLILCRAARDILGLNKGASWDDVRRNLTDEQVRRLHEVFASLWPRDTQIAELLPRPQTTRSRGVLMGLVDPRTLPYSGLALLPYLDELVLVHPFINGGGIKPEYSPLHSPAKFKEETLRNVFLLFLLEDDIARGRVHLVPDPIDFDPGFRDEIMAIAEASREKTAMGSADRWMMELIFKDLEFQTVKRLPEERQKSYLHSKMPDMSKEEIQAVYDHWQRELHKDNFALLQPPPDGEGNGSFHLQKGFGRETGLFMAAMTGSIILVESEMQWRRLHVSDRGNSLKQDPQWTAALKRLPEAQAYVPKNSYGHITDPANADAVRALLRDISVARWKEDDKAAESVAKRLDAVLSANGPAVSDLVLSLIPSLPIGGFQRKDVSRMLITFGRPADTRPAPLALFLKKMWLDEEKSEQEPTVT